MTNTVSGKILTAKSHNGISDLLVVIYDVDPKKLQSIINPNNANFSTLTHRVVPGASASSSATGGDDPAASEPVEPGTPGPDNFTIEQVLRSNANAWAEFSGDRVGSVLTDSKGYFKLDFDDEAFRVANSEKRPDLVLLVLGPDHSQGVGIVDRLLHYTYIPRENAGRLESYIIHIDEELLKKKHVPVADPITVNSIDSIRSRLAGTRTLRLAKREFFSNAFRWLSPPNLATSTRFIKPKTVAPEATIRTAIDGGVSNIRNARVRPLALTLADAEFNFLGLTIPTGSSPTRLVDVSVCDLLALKGIGAELVRTRTLLSEARARATADSTGSSVTVPTTPAEPASAPTTPTEFPAFLEDKVMGQVSELPSMPSMPPKPSASMMEELATLKGHINDLELSSGPANVTAFRDFYSLQMAFEDVWTAAFDEELSDAVKNLYHEATALDEDYGLDFPRLESTQNANELIEYLNSLSDATRDLEAELEPVPRYMKAIFPQLTQKDWNRLSDETKETFQTQTQNTAFRRDSYDTEEEYRADLETVYRYYIRDVALNESPLSRIASYITDINDRLSKPYSFKYFAPNTANYGILVSYRQEWRPQNYQVGRMVTTVPLAPGESREFTIKHQIKRSRAEKEMRKALVENSYESSATMRTELDVIAKMSTDSNFKLSAQGSFSMGIGSISSTSEFAFDQKNESSRQQKQFAEATRKASEKVRQEREVSIEQKDELESTSSSTQKIHNPNDEVTVTYLLYELERRYQVTHRLNKVTPVIMVALEMPSPHEITEAWIIEHAWILRRVLLDDSFDEAISLIEKGRASEIIDVEVKKSIFDKEKEMLTKSENDLDAVLADRLAMRNTLIGLEQQKSDYEAGAESTEGRVGDFFLSGGFSELFHNRGPDEGQLIQAQIDASKSRLKYVEDAAEEMGARLRAVRRSAKEAADAYTSALKYQAHADVTVQKFQLHLRQNIFHYMHAIWESRHPDELFFSLVDLEVPFVESATRTCDIRPATSEEEALGVPGIIRDGRHYVVECSAPEAPDPASPLPMKRLGSIANVDQLLGFKGNYAIFPLKVCSHITDYMMQEFVDDYVGVRDPANDSGYTSPELLEYASEIWSELSTEEQSALRTLITTQLSSPNNDIETIVLPTGQLYMEALKGEQALLEDFKLAHRGMDVLKVQEEIRESRLENLRRAGRLLGDEKDFTDPDIDKKIVVEGAASTVIEP